MGLAPEVDEFQAFPVDGLGQDGRGGGTVTGGVAGLAGHFPDHLGAHVFIGIFQFDFLGHGDTVLGDRGGTELFVDDHVAALGAERGRDGLGEFGHAAQDGHARGFIEEELFGCHSSMPL